MTDQKTNDRGLTYYSSQRDDGTTSFGSAYMVADGVTVYDDEIAWFDARNAYAANPPELRSFDDVKADAERAGLVAGSAMVARFKAGYLDDEPDTWPIQEAQARAVVAGTLAPSDARFLMKLTKGVYQAVTPLAERIVVKADFLEDVMAEAIVMRTEMQAIIRGSTDAADLARNMDWIETAALAKTAEFEAMRAAL